MAEEVLDGQEIMTPFKQSLRAHAMRPYCLLPVADCLLETGAEGGTRTPTVLRPSAPQAGASANSATSAFRGLRNSSGRRGLPPRR